MIFFLFIVCFVIRGQNKFTNTDKSVFFYLTTSTNKVHKRSQSYPLTLLIDNQSEDSVCIKNFNKYIFHKLDYTKSEKAFCWEFLTTSNQIPDDIVIVTAGTVKKNLISEKNIDVIIPPNTTFISDIYIQYSSFISYKKGYYKLCIYYEKNSEYIAEIIIKHE
jgi:hypothetical protein